MVANFVKVFSAFHVVGNSFLWLQEYAIHQILSHRTDSTKDTLIISRYELVIIAHTPNFKNRNFYE